MNCPICRHFSRQLGHGVRWRTRPRDAASISGHEPLTTLFGPLHLLREPVAEIAPDLVRIGELLEYRQAVASVAIFVDLEFHQFRPEAQDYGHEQRLSPLLGRLDSHEHLQHAALTERQEVELYRVADRALAHRPDTDLQLHEGHFHDYTVGLALKF